MRGIAVNPGEKNSSHFVEIETPIINENEVLVIGIFFFADVQLFFIGIIGEYSGAIYAQVKNRPLVIEKERINFDPDDSAAGKD